MTRREETRAAVVDALQTAARMLPGEDAAEWGEVIPELREQGMATPANDTAWKRTALEWMRAAARVHAMHHRLTRLPCDVCEYFPPIAGVARQGQPLPGDRELRASTRKGP